MARVPFAKGVVELFRKRLDLAMDVMPEAWMKVLTPTVQSIRMNATKLKAVAGGANDGASWYDSRAAGTDIYKHWEVTLAKVNTSRVQIVHDKLVAAVDILKQDHALFSSIIPASAFTRLEDMVSTEEMALTIEAMLKFAVTKCESMICMALSTKNPKKHILKNTSNLEVERTKMGNLGGLWLPRNPCGPEVPRATQATTGSGSRAGGPSIGNLLMVGRGRGEF